MAEPDVQAALDNVGVDPDKRPDIFFGEQENFARPSDSISAFAPGSDSLDVFDQVLSRIQRHSPEQYAALLEAAPSFASLRTDLTEDAQSQRLDDQSRAERQQELQGTRGRRQQEVDQSIRDQENVANDPNALIDPSRRDADSQINADGSFTYTPEQQAFIDGASSTEREDIVSREEKYQEAATEVMKFLSGGESLPAGFEGLSLASMNDRIMKTYERNAGNGTDVFGDSSQQIFTTNTGLLVWDQEQNKFVGNTSIHDQYGFSQGQLGLERRESTDRLIQGDELMRRFIGLDIDRLTELQEQLFIGGFYGPNVDLDNVKFGYLDTGSLEAYQNLLNRAVLYNNSNKDMTIDDIIEEGRQNSDRSLDPNDPSNQGATVTALADPGAVRMTANSTAQRLLGRKATQEEQRLILALIRDRQRENSQVRSSNVGGELIQASPEGIADEFFTDSGRPGSTAGEADTHSMVQTMSDFANIINRTVI